MSGRTSVPSAGLVRPLRSADMFKEVMRAGYHPLKEGAAPRKAKVAWCSSMGPVELLRALGFKLYFPENHAAILGTTRASMDYIPVAAAHGFSPDVCSYLTSDIGAYIRKETPLDRLYGIKSVPKPDVLVYNTIQCKEVAEWFTYFGREFNVPVIGVSSPHHVSEISVAHVSSVEAQLKALVAPLEKIADTRLDMNMLKKTVKLSHEACLEWKGVLDTAENRPSPLCFHDAVIHMGPVVILRGTQKAVDYYKAFRKELDQRVKDGQGAIPDEKYRIYWDGMPIWGRIRAHSELFAKFKACVVASTYCNSWVLDTLDHNDPFGSMAEAYTGLFINRTEGIKEGYLLGIIKNHSIDGVVFHESKTCPYNSNTRFGMPSRLEKWFRVPTLVVHGDTCDMRLVSDTQFETGIEAFIERLMLQKVEGKF